MRIFIRYQWIFIIFRMQTIFSQLEYICLKLNLNCNLFWQASSWFIVSDWTNKGCESGGHRERRQILANERIERKCSERTCAFNCDRMISETLWRFFFSFCFYRERACVLNHHRYLRSPWPHRRTVRRRGHL